MDVAQTLHAFYAGREIDINVYCFATGFREDRNDRRGTRAWCAILDVQHDVLRDDDGHWSGFKKYISYISMAERSALLTICCRRDVRFLVSCNICGSQLLGSLEYLITGRNVANCIHRMTSSRLSLTFWPRCRHSFRDSVSNGAYDGLSAGTNTSGT